MYLPPQVGIKRRYNNVLVDTDKQQQIEMFLGMKPAVYFPTTKLYYKDDALVPLDYPETDDDSDPVSAMDWVPAGDKSVHGGEGGPGSGTTHHASHSRWGLRGRL